MLSSLEHKKVTKYKRCLSKNLMSQKLWYPHTACVCVCQMISASRLFFFIRRRLYKIVQAIDQTHGEAWWKHTHSGWIKSEQTHHYHINSRRWLVLNVPTDAVELAATLIPDLLRDFFFVRYSFFLLPEYANSEDLLVFFL